MGGSSIASRTTAVIWAIHFLVSFGVVYAYFAHCTEGGSLPGGMCGIVLVGMWVLAGTALLAFGAFGPLVDWVNAVLRPLTPGLVPYEVSNLSTFVVGQLLPLALNSLLWAIVLVAGWRWLRRLRERGTGT